MKSFSNFRDIKRKLFIFATILLFLSYQKVAVSMMGTEDDEISDVHHVSKMFPGTSMPNQDWWQLLWPNPKGIILSLGVEPTMVSVDLCCGYGHFTVPLAQASLRTYGLELNSTLLEKAREETDHKNIKNCLWIQGDAMKIDSLVPEKADFILLANTLHGVPDKENLGKSIFSALKPHGKLAVVNWHKRPREETIIRGIPTGPKSEMRMSPLEVEEILRPLGFTLQRTIDFSPYHYGSIFTKETQG